jgi:hypothetical protein
MNCKNTGLCLFDEQDVQVDIRGKVITDYHPINTISPGAPIEFQILGVPDDYIDLGDIRMLLRVKIKKTDGKPWDSAADKVNFINLPLSSVFQDVFVQLGDTQIEGGQHLYPYNAYLSSLLQFHPSAKKTHMEAWGWIEDTPGKFDSDADNDGIKMRRQETDKGATWEVMGPLFLDMTRQPRYLLPQTNVRLKFLPAKAEFCLQDTGGKKVYDYEIEKCVLYVPRITVMDSVISGHNKGLEKANVKYNLNHIDISTFTITKENRSFIKDGLFTSQVPKMIVIGLLEHDAFNGNIEKSPFNFQHFNLNKIGLYRDGELVPGQIFTPDYDADFYLRSYTNTMSTLNYFNTDDSNGMTMEHFKNGYNLYAFDLTPDGSNQGPHRHLVKTGSLRLELAFSKNLTSPITVMLFSIIDAKLEITKLRDVITSYSR